MEVPTGIIAFLIIGFILVALTKKTEKKRERSDNADYSYKSNDKMYVRKW